MICRFTQQPLPPLERVRPVSVLCLFYRRRINHGTRGVKFSASIRDDRARNGRRRVQRLGAVRRREWVGLSYTVRTDPDVVIYAHIVVDTYHLGMFSLENVSTLSTPPPPLRCDFISAVEKVGCPFKVTITRPLRESSPSISSASFLLVMPTFSFWTTLNYATTFVQFVLVSVYFTFPHVIQGKMQV